MMQLTAETKKAARTFEAREQELGGIVLMFKSVANAGDGELADRRRQEAHTALDAAFDSYASFITLTHRDLGL